MGELSFQRSHTALFIWLYKSQYWAPSYKKCQQLSQIFVSYWGLGQEKIQTSLNIGPNVWQSLRWCDNDWGTCWGEEPPARILFLSAAVHSKSIQVCEKVPQIVGISESLKRGKYKEPTGRPLTTWLKIFI